MLFITRSAAYLSGIRAKIAGRADHFVIQRKWVRQPDRSFDYGFRCVLRKNGKVVGFGS